MLIGAMLFAACTPDLSVGTEEAATEEANSGDGLSGQLQIAGSTTVQPLAEVLAEAFMADNPDVMIEVQGGGSSVGVTSAGEGTVDIGEASRNVKDSEFEEFPGLQVFTIAYDGIAIVTNPDLDLPTLSIDQVKAIFAGEIANYSEVGGPDAEIVVVSREEGSGTRAAFEELVMASGDTEAVITEDALLQQSNGQVRTTVAETPDTIAYVSFGFIDDSISTVAIDNVDPTVANVKNGSYPIFRPLNMLTNGAPSALAQAFLDYILSDAGQAIVAEDYITVTDEEVMEEETAAGLSGQIQLAGSTTVQPLAEVLAEAFMDANPDVMIEVQGGGSSVGVTSAGEGTVDIGNASRNVKDSEFETFADLQVFTIAYDGIAIVTNPDLALGSLSIDQVKAIFAGEITNFSEVGGPDAEIIVVSREEGSGTRAAFEELVMESGDTEAVITENALLQQSNGQVRTTVAETPDTIGYLSFGFLDESINTVAIDGVDPTVANVKNGTYPIFRPLNMLTNGAPGELAQAFLDYILGAAGQEIVAEDYITVTDEEGMEDAFYTPPTDLSGQIQLAGSTTVQPLAEVLSEAFMGYNPDLMIEVQGGGSSVGVTSAGEGTVDIGNASRNIKDSEFETFPELQVFTIAFDGIAIVTNPDLELASLSVEQVKAIFAGEITNFSEVGGPDAEIIVVSREEGSGTRAAFEELVMATGDTEAVITDTALLQQSNGQVRTTVAETPNTIGFLSFGFLDESINAVAIDGVAPTTENVKNGTYSIFRPLNMLTNGTPGELAQAFLDFILRDLGQEIVAEDYITVK
jgi:phosphate transport system substrate-binding protein